MAGLLVVLVILGCAAYQYLKGTLVQAFATLVAAICASVVAFGYFEVLARALAGLSSSLASWAQMVSFAMLFIIFFAVLQTAVVYLTRQKIDLGLLPERIGRIVCGIFLGLIISGLLLTALATAPLSNSFPYQRFDQRDPDAERPDKVLLNADGFVTGWFSMLSCGSFSGKRSFATLHPNFLDQIFLNRHSRGDGVSIMTASKAIEVQRKNSAWLAPENMRDSDGKTLPPKSGHNLVIVRVGIKKSALKDVGSFTLSQLRLVCKPKDLAKNPLSGKGENIYPVGYLKSANQLQKKKLNDQIKLKSADFSGSLKDIDFAFYVPSYLTPVLVEFKLNNIAEVPAPVPAEQAPSAVPFTESSENNREVEKPDNSSDNRGLSNIGRSIIGDQLEENQ